MSKPINDGFEVNDTRRVVLQDDHVVVRDPTEPPESSDDGSWTVLEGDVRRTYRWVPQSDGTKRKMLIREDLEMGPQACEWCSGVHMRYNNDRPNRPEDCPRHPTNAVVAALYPAGPPNRDQRQVRQASLRRALENYDTEALERHQSHNLNILGRIIGA